VGADDPVRFIDQRISGRDIIGKEVSESEEVEGLPAATTRELAAEVV
jgi:hypothetical protein